MGASLREEAGSLCQVYLFFVKVFCLFAGLLFDCFFGFMMVISLVTRLQGGAIGLASSQVYEPQVE